MKSERFETISPIIDRYHPDASDAEKAAMTVELRNYLAVLYRIFCRVESEERLEPDSRDSGNDAMLGVIKPPNS